MYLFPINYFCYLWHYPAAALMLFCCAAYLIVTHFVRLNSREFQKTAKSKTCENVFKRFSTQFTVLTYFFGQIAKIKSCEIFSFHSREMKFQRK